jgi:hypothetical protein
MGSRPILAGGPKKKSFMHPYQESNPGHPYHLASHFTETVMHLEILTQIITGNQFVLIAHFMCMENWRIFPLLCCINSEYIRRFHFLITCAYTHSIHN